MIRVARGVIFLVACAVAVAHSNGVNAANVNVTLSPTGMAPDPAIINVGDTVTFTCDSLCNGFCDWNEASGNIPGISPFGGSGLFTGTTSAAFGPATAAGSLTYWAMDSIPVCSDDSSTIIANPASFDPQPYLVYDSIQEALDPNPVVDLEDQFGLKEDVPVVNQGYFMNPVQKQPIEPEGEPELVTDPVLHYRWLGLDPSSPEGPTVLVTDQFGDNVTWVISKIPLYLLAPTSKLVGPGEPGPPPAGQHYTCYIEVGSLVDPAATVQLSDQFALHGPLEVGRAFFLCAPAEKTHDGDVYPIIPASDGRDHLACYEVPMESHVVTVSTRNQFSGLDPDEFGSPVWDRMLCVPAIKTHPGFFPPVPSLRPGGIVALGLLMLLTTFWVVQRRLRCARAA